MTAEGDYTGMLKLDAFRNFVQVTEASARADAETSAKPKAKISKSDVKKISAEYAAVEETGQVEIAGQRRSVVWSLKKAFAPLYWPDWSLQQVLSIFCATNVGRSKAHVFRCADNGPR